MAAYQALTRKRRAGLRTAAWLLTALAFYAGAPVSAGAWSRGNFCSSLAKGQGASAPGN